MSLYEIATGRPLPEFDDRQGEFLREMRDALQAVVAQSLERFNWDFYEILDVLEVLPTKKAPEGFCESEGCALGARGCFLAPGDFDTMRNVIREGGSRFGRVDDRGVIYVERGETMSDPGRWYSWAFFNSATDEGGSPLDPTTPEHILARVLEALREPA